ncbi:hypothetical protein FYJ26_04445 [Anaerococcus sp. WCA-380-WT-2B]|uniref:Uncharacterized protein n=1 Tax=Anaerococcus porci TaxID=2652269 RepID=A0A6N7VUC2_9FIRM|nr:hypothetical protein [Anaerococcus porci]MSS77663.1 hypothetical protein [Anaerococcus porci]
MKRLISQEEVLKNKDQKEIFVDKNTLITAAARDLCKDLGIEIKCINSVKEVEENKESTKKEYIEIKEKENKKENQAVLSENQIYNILKDGINQGLISESDIERMLG